MMPSAAAQPTSASVHLVMGYPNARTGVKITGGGGERESLEQRNATQISTPITNYH